MSSDLKEIKKLQSLASDFTILYVEDNELIREKGSQILKKFFNKTYIASNGLEGVAIYKKYSPKIVLMDINMPQMNGLEMAENILALNPDVKFIVTSAIVESKLLIQALNIGIHRFLPKPFNAHDLIRALSSLIEKSKNTCNSFTPESYIKEAFDTYDSLVAIYEKTRPILANKAFLNFFGSSTLEELEKNDYSLKLRLFTTETDSSDGINIFTKAMLNPGHFYHIKLSDTSEKLHHFLFKMINIGESDHHFVVMEDVTDLGIFDEGNTVKEKATESGLTDVSRNIAKALHLKNKPVECKINNYYRGMVITHESSISIYKDIFELKTHPTQLMAAEINETILLTGEIFGNEPLKSKVISTDVSSSSLHVKSIFSVEESYLSRKSPRYEVSDECEATVIYKTKTFFEEKVKLVDISEDAIRFRMPMMPAVLKIGIQAQIKVKLIGENNVYDFTSNAKIFRIDHFEDFFEVIVIMNNNLHAKKKINEYLMIRQRELISELKKLY
jgi:CheY-like chemotaxis protein